MVDWDSMYDQKLIRGCSTPYEFLVRPDLRLEFCRKVSFFEQEGREPHSSTAAKAKLFLK